MPDQIFISYRRDDAAYVTGHINDRLRKEFGDEAVFTDVDNLALGVDFRAVLDETVAKCHILLAVIGDNWITVKNADGQLRLHDPADFVRIEIESALQRNIPVIPLLVAGTKMPTEEELPDSLRNLAFRNGTQIRPAPDFHTDMDRLIKNLNKHLLSIRANEKNENSPAPTSSAGPADGQNQDQTLADVNPKRDADAAKSGFAEVDVRLEEDDKKRKQIELGTPDARRKRGVARTLLIFVGLILAAGAASFVYVKYQEQVRTTNAALASIQKAAADAEAKREADADAAARREAEADAVAQAERDANALAEANDETGVANETPPTALVDSDTSPAADPEADARLLAAAQVILDADAEARLTADAEAEAKRTADAVDETRRATQAAAGRKAAADANANRKIDATAALREGISLAGFGDHAAAIQNYDEAIRLGVETPAFAYRQRGASYHALGDYQAAIKDYEEVLRLEPQDANVYYKRGVSNYALRDYQATVSDCSEAIRLDPEFAAAYSVRSSAYESLGYLDDAESDRAMVEQLKSGRNEPN